MQGPRVLLPQVDQIMSVGGDLPDESVGELLEQAMGSLLGAASRLKD